MEQPKVYADVSFLINFFMDFMILWATAKLSGTAVRYGRLLAVAVLGGIYGVLYLLPQMSFWFNLPIKILFSLIIIILAFPPKGWKEFKTNLINFYAVSFCMAGATIAVSCFQGGASREIDFYYWCLLGGIGCALFVGSYAGKYLARKIIPALLKYRVELHFGKKSCMGEGFLDTGNSLRDPLTRRPVVVAEYDLVRECFPDDCKAVLDNCEDENEVFQGLSNSSWANRLRLIPYQSIGQKNGLMVGFRCDEVVVDPGKINLLYKNLVVAIYQHRLGLADGYQLLIPSEILQKI
ncbi:MAG: sigma-E processing peptidase SpoIIGA [Syntrophomonadaceae bacterium]|nr:sigma-E processing peptidase SpoIIGA [Syntrophomonadaceae bacterium]